MGYARLRLGRGCFYPIILANGVTDIRDMGDDMKSLVAFRQQIEFGKRPGPRIYFAGQIIDGLRRANLPFLFSFANAPDEARASKRVGIMGGSYGGYAALAGAAFTPDLYAAAVAVVAPSNLITLVESFPAYWKARRQRFYERMGNPNTPEGKARLERQLPLNSAAKIKTPLMVMQGANDPRVNKREADQIVIALRDRSFPVEYIVAPDEGHGFARPVNNMAMLAAAEKFLAKHLGGQFQQSMPPEVVRRLREITVDPKSVKIVRESGDSSPLKP
jgi:dienelactone hydrolase